MRQTALCFALVLLLAGAASTQAECVANPESPLDGGDPNACRKCAGGKCKQCWPGWAVNKKGECTECTGVWCLACTAEKPGVCQTCGDWSGESDTGYFAKNGKCKACPAKNCMACKNGSGKCTQCAAGMGVVGSACRPCKQTNKCVTCNGNLAKCQECMSGYYVDKKTGQCQSCPPNCEKCKNGKECLVCSSDGFVLDKTTKQCVPCASKGCTNCPQGKNVCSTCDEGYTMMPDHTCAKCAAEHCTTCKRGDPSVCKICASTSSDPWWGGPSANRRLCVPCKSAKCAACQTSWDACDWCEGGFFNDAKLKECTPCTDRWPHCNECGLNANNGDPGIPACFGCEKGWQPDPNAADGKCIPAN